MTPDHLPPAAIFSSAGLWQEWKFSGIYSFVNRGNGKVYVGQAGNVTKRLRTHRRLSGSHCTALQRAFQKYGFDAFSVLVLERVDDLSTITEREQFWIDTMRACDREAGYNINPRADSRRGAKLSAESIARMRITSSNRSAETRAKMSAASSNPSDETRAKMSAAKEGKHVSRNHHASLIESHRKLRKPIVQVSKTGEDIKEWEGIVEAGGALGIDSGHISACCRGDRKTIGGFTWRYARTT